jgi:hypothetical protein
MNKISALEAYKITIVLEEVSYNFCFIFVLVHSKTHLLGLAQAKLGR